MKPRDLRRSHSAACDELLYELVLEASGPTTTTVRARLHADATGVIGRFVSERSLREKRESRSRSDLASLAKRFDGLR